MVTTQAVTTPKDLVDLEGSMGHNGDADRDGRSRWSAQPTDRILAARIS